MKLPVEMNNFASNISVDKSEFKNLLIANYSFRIFLTLFILIWGIVFCVLYGKTDPKDELERDKLQFYHRVWFGETSLFYLIFIMWIITILALLFIPILKKMFVLKKQNQ